jgi:ankyrin repeat protein
VNARDADGNTPLHLAAIYAGPECVELLLKKGADANAKNKFEATPLHRAATNYEKAKLLIDGGADVKAETRSGRTPLTLAARKFGNSKTVKLLIVKGANAKECNDRGITPIQVAACCGDLDTVKLLVEAGADCQLDRSGDPGDPALRLAGGQGRVRRGRRSRPQVALVREARDDRGRGVSTTRPALGGRAS